jgi:protein gp37
MGAKTHIQWCDSTCNPTGFQCVGCELWIPGRNIRKCYAGQFAERMGGAGAFDKPVELKPGVTAKTARLGDLQGKPRKDKPWIPTTMPRMIFTGDMADIFSPSVPFEFLRDEILAVAESKNGSRHIWQLSTKQGNRLADFSQWHGKPWPANVWMGVSVTSLKTEWRVQRLAECGAKVRYVNFAPAWEWVDFSPYAGKIHQVIVEGESSNESTAGFDTGIAYGTITTCREAGIAPFIKQLGAAPFSRSGRMSSLAPLILKDKTHGGDWSEWPEFLRVREFPKL